MSLFSYNHMLKARNGSAEIPIGDLRERDQVSFSIGVNYKGTCAIDVALVARALDPDAPASPSAPIQEGIPRRNSPPSPDLVEIVKDAVAVCADEEGWALAATVGKRARTLFDDFAERLKKSGDQKLITLARAHPDVFEVSDGVGTRYAAACIRLRRDAT